MTRIDDGYQSANEKIRFIIRVQQDIFATPCVSMYVYVA